MHPKILVAYDFSSTADAALDWACNLAGALDGTLKLIYVLPVPPVAMAPEVVVPIFPSEGEIAQAREELRAAAARHGVEPEIQVVVGGHVGQSVIAAARAHGAELIVMGTHGRGVIGRVVLGSAAEYVVRHADCPVVTLRAAAVASAHAAPGAGAGKPDRPPSAPRP